MNPNILISVCARGGSKGIPGKNLKSLNGKPLIDYTLGFINELKGIIEFDLYFSTDDQKIKTHLINEGYEVPNIRDKTLAMDHTPKIDVIRNVLLNAERLYGKTYDYVIDLDVTSPLRNQNDILEALNRLKKDENALNIFSVSKSRKNPYFNMIEKKEDGYFKKVITKDNITGRQQAPVVFELNASFYILTNAFLKGDYIKMVTERSLIYEMPHICFDIDEPEDFKLMEAVLQNNLFQF
jgi:N-acylneuraminate cytidylyltransferase